METLSWSGSSRKQSWANDWCVVRGTWEEFPEENIYFLLEYLELVPSSPESRTSIEAAWKMQDNRELLY